MRSEDVPFRTTRIRELQRLERSERALARAYRWHAQRDGAEADILQRLATLHDGNAALLRARLHALGGRPVADPSLFDADWLRGEPGERADLGSAEQAALATYHDHLSDFDPETAEVIQLMILPGLRVARDWHERDQREARISEL